MKVLDGVLGFAIGDSLGVPVEFVSRLELSTNPVLDMEGNGTHNQVEGTWSDDTSMLIATMDAIIDAKNIDYKKIMDNFCLWYYPHQRDVCQYARRTGKTAASPERTGC